MANFVSNTRVHGPKLIMGDWNACLYKRLPGEEDILGMNVLSNDEVTIPENANRHLLMELCESEGLAIANTFFNTLLCLQ